MQHDKKKIMYLWKYQGARAYNFTGNHHLFRALVNCTYIKQVGSKNTIVNCTRDFSRSKMDIVNCANGIK